MDIKQLLQEFKERLQAHYKDNLKGVVLFGSVARGDNTQESDIDVLIVLGKISNFDEEFNRVFEIKRALERKYDDEVMISAIPTTEEDYRSRFTPLLLNIRKEGVPI